ncbi:MAG: PKD domain-containing protein, partial [Thermoplasmata archaeon]|nr:PKD domain-containing protein [Thermoplasmata archaeon]
MGGEEDYKTYLYGDDATNQVYTGQYRLRYDVGDGEVRVFQPTFTIDVPTSVDMDKMVEFRVTCDSYILLDHPTLVHAWYLGDEEEPEVPFITSTDDPNVTVTITEPGEYDYVRYMYKIGNFTVRSDVARIVVRNVWPVADAGENQTIYQDESFELDGSLSNDTTSDNDTLEFNWTFGGKQTDWSMDPTYPVDTSLTRKFTAYLTVRDRHGKWTQGSVTIDIINKPPEARVGEDMTSDEDEVVELTGLGIDSVSDADTLEFRWVFGDDMASQWSLLPGTNHTYIHQGTYTVTLHVKDSKGASNSTALSITVNNVAPEAGIDSPKDGAKAVMDSKLKFTCWSRDTTSDNGSLWYTWDFDDGTTASGAHVSHTYKEAGRYTVTLTVEDNDGATIVVTHNLTIEEAGTSLDSPIVFTVTVGFLAMLGLAFLAATEPGKYWFGLLGAPLFTKTEDVLDNKTRHALLGIIVTNPGIHYSALREEFGLANGAAAYHLDVLERESFIRS